jgi:hypothetical protein
MTTAWSHFVRGQMADALAANVGGALLALAAAVMSPWAVLAGICGRPIGPRISDGVLVIAIAVVTLITIAEWLGRITMGL